jgi:hypothetical protein
MPSNGIRATSETDHILEMVVSCDEIGPAACFSPSLETGRLVGGAAAGTDQQAVMLWRELGYHGPAG